MSIVSRNVVVHIPADSVDRVRFEVLKDAEPEMVEEEPKVGFFGWLKGLFRVSL